VGWVPLRLWARRSTIGAAESPVVARLQPATASGAVSASGAARSARLPRGARVCIDVPSSESWSLPRHGAVHILADHVVRIDAGRTGERLDPRHERRTGLRGS